MIVEAPGEEGPEATRRDRKKASAKRWRDAHKEQIRAYNVSSEGREKNRARCRAYRERHPERRRKSKAAYYRRNREKCYADVHKRLARKKRARGQGWTAADVRCQYQAQRGKCFYCKRALGKAFERDHVIPLSRGGAHCRSNLVLACRPCNRSKAGEDPQIFAGILL